MAYNKEYYMRNRDRMAGHKCAWYQKNKEYLRKKNLNDYYIKKEIKAIISILSH